MLVDLEAIPNEKWSLKELTAFAKGLVRRSGSDAWLLGTAINIAKNHHSRSYERWVKKIGISPTTAWRYRQIAERCNLNETAGRSIFDLQVDLGLQERVVAQASAPEEHAPGDNSSWAVPMKHRVVNVVDAVNMASTLLTEYDGPVVPRLAKSLDTLKEAVEHFFLKERNGTGE